MNPRIIRTISAQIVVCLCSAISAFALTNLIAGDNWITQAILLMVVLCITGILARTYAPNTSAAMLIQLLIIGITAFSLFYQANVSPAEVLGDAAHALRMGVPPMQANYAVQIVLILIMGFLTLVVDIVVMELGFPAIAIFVLLLPWAPAIALSGSIPTITIIMALISFALLMVIRPTSMKGTFAIPRASLAVGVSAVLAIVVTTNTGFAQALPRWGSGEQAASNSSIAMARAGFMPVVDVGIPLSPRSDSVVLSYTFDTEADADNTTPTEAWRTAVYDSFDGMRWHEQQTQLEPIDSFGFLNQYLDSPNPQSRLVTVHIENLYEHRLPLAYPVESVFDLPDDSWGADATVGVVQVLPTSIGTTTSNLKYSFFAITVKPDIDSLRQAGQTLAPESTGTSRIDEPAAALAQQLTQGIDNRYDKILALQDYLRTTGGFVYDEAGPVRSSPDVVENFLTSKRGYCVQFATAMTLMTQSLGIRSRYVEGFLPGTRQGDGRWNITGRDQHAWTEIFFDGYGWMRFDPTPSVQSGTAPLWQPAIFPTATPTQPSPTPTEQSASPSTPTPAIADAATPDATNPAMWGLAGAAGVVLIALGAFIILRRTRQTPSLETTWSRMSQQVRKRGLPWEDSWSPRHVASVLTLREPFSQDEQARNAMTRLADSVEKYRYSRSATPVASQDIQAWAKNIQQALRRRR